MNAEALNLYLRLAPETFSIVRDPLRRFISAFQSKVFSDDDPLYYPFRDALTSLDGIDLSPEVDPAQSCLAFARWVAGQKSLQDIDAHFRPQHMNLTIDGRFTIDTILRMEHPEALQAYFARWVGDEKAKWLLGFRFNAQTRFKTADFMSDELAALVREIYAQDYALFYP